ncbi:MAG: DUF2075 domain-containing protein [Methanobacteriota archaeon]|nr:MAG: DUF2075 domain-containing protein [Euryarchaeota archaeon]
MSSAFYGDSIASFLKKSTEDILGEIVKRYNFSLQEQQKNAWLQEIRILKNQLSSIGEGYVIFEYLIPRFGKRVDVVLLIKGVVFVLEFKVGEKRINRHNIDQVVDYCLDLKNFHEKSHDTIIVPILVATESEKESLDVDDFGDGVLNPLVCNKFSIAEAIIKVVSKYPRNVISPTEWMNSAYRPTPTIIEAAQALYSGHGVKEISRSESDVYNLSATTSFVNTKIDEAKRKGEKIVCFITGVPGAGKTLAGLNIASERHEFEEEHAVFLSGNGPLVKVLQEALALYDKNKFKNKKSDALRKARAFIQNVHHFRDDAFRNLPQPPIEKVIIFDEAQRAWDLTHTQKFMKKKKGVENFEYSEPEFLIEVMDHHEGWAAIVCLVGGGQEINTGEAGFLEWLRAVKKYPDWRVVLPPEIQNEEYSQGEDINDHLSGLRFEFSSHLHLKTSIRSFRSEKMASFVDCLLNLRIERAKELFEELRGRYPVFLTRKFNDAKKWLRKSARGSERIGVVASSGAYRLKPCGIVVKSASFDPVNWFLKPKEDIRSSYYLEEVATEFDIQGLELDWVCVAWDADLRLEKGKWKYMRFRGTSWQEIHKNDAKLYLLNAYRVLLTRARQGMVIFIPEGNDEDSTRLRQYYDGVYEYLKKIGLPEI